MNHPSYRQAHPLARPLMDEDFYYSPIEESGPFGSDDAADTFAGFCQWRPGNKEVSPLEYLKLQFEDWEYPPLDWKGQQENTVDADAVNDRWELTFLIGRDAAIVALAFGQLYLEGSVAPEVRDLAKRSIDRQLHPEFIGFWDAAYQPIRQEQLLKMLSVLNRA